MELKNRAVSQQADFRAGYGRHQGRDRHPTLRQVQPAEADDGAFTAAGRHRGPASLDEF